MSRRKWTRPQSRLLAVLCLAAASMAALPAPAGEVPTSCSAHADADRVLIGPILADGPTPSRLAPAQPEPTEKPLPINLATALRLADARPVIIAAAEASVAEAAAALTRAKVAWLPSVGAGAGYYHHEGATQGQSGTFYINRKDQAMIGGGLTARFAFSDALFAPLSARQVVRARQFEMQTARNDVLLRTAEAYFNVQQARGRVAATEAVVEKNRELRKVIDLQQLGASHPTDVHRAEAQLAEFEEEVLGAREQWRLASADLTEVLRLDPTATVVPLEPPQLRVTLIAPQETVDALIPIGLTNRPELASQQALVQAALARLRQERMRPLVPSLILEGSPGAAGPGGYWMGGVFGSGLNGTGNPWMGRADVSAGLVWEMENFGLGNRARVRERRAQQQQVTLELFHLQDRIAAEIARAHTQVQSSANRILIAERGVREAQAAYEGSISELGKVAKVGAISVQVRREFEVIEALKKLFSAYDSFLQNINNYNRAQFRLFRALGYPAGVLACERPAGPEVPVDTTRPPSLAPVCPAPACSR